MKKICLAFVAGILIFAVSACNIDIPANMIGQQNTGAPVFSGLNDMIGQADLIIQLQDAGLVKTVLKGEKSLLYSSMTDNIIHVKKGINDILFLKKTDDNTYEFIENEKKNLFSSKTDTPDQYRNASGDVFVMGDLIKGISPRPQTYDINGEKGKSFAGLKQLVEKSDIVVYYDGYLSGQNYIKKISDDKFEDSDFYYKNISLSTQDVTRILFIKKVKKGYQYIGGINAGCFTNKKGLIYKNKKGDIINIKDLFQ